MLGAAGAAAGKIGQLHHRRELARELESAIQPGHSGIVALVFDPAAVELRQALRMADTIVQTAIDDVVAKDVKAAAKEAKDAEQAASDAPGDVKQAAGDADARATLPPVAPTWRVTRIVASGPTRRATAARSSGGDCAVSRVSHWRCADSSLIGPGCECGCCELQLTCSEGG